VKETNWFFRLSAFREALLERYTNNPDACQPASARNEVISFLSGDVSDLSISRSTFSWGIPVPWDSEQVVYVWFDALLNYATAVGLGDETGTPGAEQFERIWPASVHLVGKDILRFHAVIWPAMLMAAGLPLPEKVFAHGWLLVGGEKMSKSKLTGISPTDITSHFGVDAYRYYFMRAISFGSDGSFSWEDIAARYTSELANDFGNLASRTIAMIEKYRDGKVPSPSEEPELATLLKQTVENADKRMVDLDFQGALNAIMDYCKRVNGYVTEHAPWVLAKDEKNQEHLDRVLYATAESLRALAVLLYPVMPQTCEKLWDSLGATSSMGKIDEQQIAMSGTWGLLPGKSQVSKGEVLFPRLEQE
jgi:methionyl-tRNA synthetase